VAQTRKSGFHISYVTITYRSVALAVLCVILLIALIVNIAFPQASEKVARVSGEIFDKVLNKVGLGSNASANGNTGEPGPQQAHFTNIDGTVRVKRISTNSWVPADYNVALEKGDVVQTSSEGIAKVVFADGTNYTVKPDSLIVVQDNSVNSAQQTSVAVQVTTGTVDLSTSTMSHGSKSQVIVAGATANLSPDTSAEVVNDNRSDQHAILLKKGSATVSRNSETVKLGDYERVSFKVDSPQMSKTKEIGPPTLIEPANMYPVLVGSTAHPVTFSWTPMDNVKQYRVKISKNPYFSSTVFNGVVEASQIQLTNLPEGAYYWEVQSIGGSNKESVESEKNRFTLIVKQEDQANIALELEPFVQHGHILEIRGRTEGNARVMVNDQQVAMVNNDGSFHHLTSPLPSGENVITVTAQNAKGGVSTKTQKVFIQ
jgi:urease accessory protein UreE